MLVVFSVHVTDGTIEIARANMHEAPRAGEIVNLQLSGPLESFHCIRLKVKAVEWDADAHFSYQSEPSGLATLFVVGADDEAKSYIEQCIREENE